MSGASRNQTDDSEVGSALLYQLTYSCSGLFFQTQGYFRWMDGWPLSLARWAPGEPSRDRSCVYLDVEGTWKTALCNHTYPSVCKQSTGETVTEPGVLVVTR